MVKTLIQKIFLFVLALFFVFNLSLSAYAQNDITIPGGNTQTESATKYNFLAPLTSTSFSVNDACPFGEYLGTIINIFLGILALLAMFMIVLGGVEYMSSELISSKQAGKDRMVNAVLGLLIALSAWLILETINPKLLDVCLKLPEAKIEIGPAAEGSGSFTPISKNALESMGVFCPESGGATNLVQIANSFIGKVTYSQQNRGTYNAGVPTAYLDCSSFVKQVYHCAGLDFPGNNTASMFPGTPLVTNIQGNNVNGQTLQIGNLLGWTKGQSSKYPNAGHVVMYIGGGQFIEVHGGSSTNQAVSVRSLNYYLNEYKHVIWLP